MSDAPRLFLITPPIADAERFKPFLETAVASAEVACVLIRTAARDDGAAKAIIKTLAPIAQARDAAVIVDLDPRIAARVDVDGVQLAGPGAGLAEALGAFQPRKIVGVGPLSSRDAAMEAGEAGVDYLMFGAPGGGEDHQAIIERVGWWAEIFNIPCVGYARHPDLAEDMARTGADFVALCEGLWDRPDMIAETLATAARALVPVAEAAR